MGASDKRMHHEPTHSQSAEQSSCGVSRKLAEVAMATIRFAAYRFPLLNVYVYVKGNSNYGSEILEYTMKFNLPNKIGKKI